jgi:hypothetical protein
MGRKLLCTAGRRINDHCVVIVERELLFNAGRRISDYYVVIVEGEKKRIVVYRW